MKIRFKLAADDLNRALDIVSIVTPKAITPQGGTGFLFVVQGQTCRVYSRDSLHAARAEFPITDVEGEGAFICPTTPEPFRCCEGQQITFEADENDKGEFVVSYESTGGANSKKMSFNPKLIATLDKDYSEATGERTFSVGILREAFTESRPFLPKPTDSKAEEQFKTLQIFDESKEEWARGKNNLYVSNGVQAFYFQCEAFSGAGLAVHGQHLPLLTSFLAKAKGKVTVKDSANMTFASDESGSVLGWTHHVKSHGKFAYYAAKYDQYVVRVPKHDLLKSLKYLRSEMDPKRDKIRVLWDDAEKKFMFQALDGSNVINGFPVFPKNVDVTAGKDFSCNVNIDHMSDLFADMKSNIAELRVLVNPPSPQRPKGAVMFRTIDEFFLDDDGKVSTPPGAGVDATSEKGPEKPVYQCRVTRFVPAKD
jgi:hypothetical protein